MPSYQYLKKKDIKVSKEDLYLVSEIKTLLFVNFFIKNDTSRVRNENF